jgi:hypothetical protein
MKYYANMSQFLYQLNYVKANLNDEIFSKLPRATSELARKIGTRVKTKGKDSDDRSFSAYSRRSINRKKRSGVGIWGTQTKFKNFTWKDTMWNNFNMTGITEDIDGIKSHIGFTGSHEVDGKRFTDIHDEQSEIEVTDISAPNEEEEKELVEEVERIIFAYFDKIL